VGGTNPSLLEAMASYALIIAHNNIFNKSVLGDDAFYFKNSEQIARIINKETNRENHRSLINNNICKIQNLYSWEHIINLLENYLLHVVEKSGQEKQL
jgi:glycosyltransferase involved in cell wall biosynthesis